ncbi:hypothetical protein A2154_03740 [Candidatus Gottesmanbacteria bacterium RBG_16_43_7]|uniref:Glycosyltransferase RgtA/B/C/D-like domain-containing protein n=1 Tax=Candidatus Gottesmanbacteria bacterium RBG_16_43_7 TaxID=1798373 RepID=A0A1F5Z9R0_9BACT|nr:MAG: hypothetical protein A2154_03740 [Candidatus Gottesmanbacteria bacterium RBG_16_43_7]
MAKFLKYCLIYLSVIFISIHALISIQRIISTYAPDFSVLYVSAGNLIAGRQLYGANLYTELAYPPFTLLVFLPFLLIPFTPAQALWVIASFIAFLAIVYMCLKLAVPKPDLICWMFACSLFFIYFPTKYTLGMGQLNFIALFGLILAIFLNARNRYQQAAMSLAFGLILKPQLILILPFLHLFWKNKVVQTGISIMILVILGGIIIFGLGGYLTYVTDIVPLYADFSARQVYYNQNLAALFSRLLPTEPARYLSYLSSIGLYLSTFLFVLRHQKITLADLAVVFPLLLLVEPLAWQHHYVFLIPAFIFLWPQLNMKYRSLLIISGFLIGWNIKSPQNITSWASPLILSHTCIGAMMLYLICLKQLLTGK